MADIIAQVGEIYKGWEILAIRQGPFGGLYYKLRCKCKLEREYSDSLLLFLKGEEGCKKCTNSSRKLFKIGDKIGNYEIMDSGQYHLGRGHIYKFKCLICNFEKCIPGNKLLTRSKCKNCISQVKGINKVAIGNIYGLWTVIRRLHKNKARSYLYLCECKCGALSNQVGYLLINGKTTKCRSCSARKRYGIEQPKAPKLAEYNNPYLNFCITPKTMDELIEYFGLRLDEIQDILMDLMLEEKIEQNNELLWETI